MGNLAPVSVRFSAEERSLLEAAAEGTRTNLSDFIRRKAIEAAELQLMERRIVTIPAKDWDKFMEWVTRPAEDLPKLRAQLARKPVWED